MTSTQTFTYDGATVAQSFVVPWHVPGSLTITLLGGGGGMSGGSGADGRRPGPPGKIAGHLTIAALTSLSIIVGGTPAQYAGPTVGVAGWLGGDGGGTGTGHKARRPAAADRVSADRAAAVSSRPAP